LGAGSESSRTRPFSMVRLGMSEARSEKLQDVARLIALARRFLGGDRLDLVFVKGGRRRFGLGA
jgi:hypothetical protein